MWNVGGKFFKRASAAIPSPLPWNPFTWYSRVRVKNYRIGDNSLRSKTDGFCTASMLTCSQASFNINASRLVSILHWSLHRIGLYIVVWSRQCLWKGHAWRWPSHLLSSFWSWGWNVQHHPHGQGGGIAPKKESWSLYLMHARLPSRIWSHGSYPDWRVMSRSAFMKTREK